ncbi:hypothetical protein AArc1_2206 [Natrarchaeobaculum sulfurireducens]|uniref:Uncharacterized protein n=1 Tax=Natrarchaeobaculum sulfurireducens TaxID=2044521 RepID=A0A346PG77_9EURY|nr:hypothetical protein AArc1_2206 [Natrarchaeobaculum sulfurireducens]
MSTGTSTRGQSIQWLEASRVQVVGTTTAFEREATDNSGGKRPPHWKESAGWVMGVAAR